MAEDWEEKGRRDRKRGRSAQFRYAKEGIRATVTPPPDWSVEDEVKRGEPYLLGYYADPQE